jgi:hypothetical protein
MLYLPNEYSQESRLKICVFKTDRSRWAMRSRRLPNPSPPRRRRVAATGHHPRLPPSRG